MSFNNDKDRRSRRSNCDYFHSGLVYLDNSLIKDLSSGRVNLINH